MARPPLPICHRQFKHQVVVRVGQPGPPEEESFRQMTGRKRKVEKALRLRWRALKQIILAIGSVAPVWHNQTMISDTEKQFSLTRAVGGLAENALTADVARKLAADPLRRAKEFSHVLGVKKHEGSSLGRQAVTEALPIGHDLVFLLLAAISLCTAQVFAASTKDYTVLAEATVTENPPSIVLSWPVAVEPKATGYQISRKLRTDAAWGPAVSIPRTSTSWTDNSVSVGIKYEYQLKRTSTILVPSPVEGGGTTALVSYGYLCAGIRLPPVDHRGTVILVVDNTMATPLSAELSRLREDLAGDGWRVIRHDVSRTVEVTTVKALIKADYAAAPSEVRAVLLFGHVPVARSGDIAPGGHADVHRGAFPTDLYYGEMDGRWTDSTVNSKTAVSNLSACWNVPGDGKFDQNWVPGPTAGFLPGGAVELEVGRIDLWGMTSFLPKTETDLLRQYLDKDHAHRHGMRVLPRRALITDNYGIYNGAAPAQSGWRSWSSLFGAANVSEGSFGALETNGCFGYYMNGAGDNNWCEPIRTVDFAKQDPKTAFVMMYGSHFSDWNYADNILRAPLCTSSGLASVYSGYPLWFLHTLSLGGTFGEAARLVQNNFYTAGDPLWPITYNPASGGVAQVHVSLHGDPTLRLLAVVPPTALTIATNGNGNPELSWTASVEASLGYLIYRGDNPGGPFIRLTPEPVAQTAYIDSSVFSGSFTYQVKAAKLDTTAGGTFANTSQALSGTIALGDPIRPTLTASFAGGILELTWPSSAEGYELQAAPELNGLSAWQKVPGIPVTNGDRRVMTLVPGQATRFFRLSRR